jgi:hypothetical protein
LTADFTDGRDALIRVIWEIRDQFHLRLQLGRPVVSCGVKDLVGFPEEQIEGDASSYGCLP